MSAMGNIQAKSGRDRRYWPRMNGGVTVAYRVIAPDAWDEQSTAWMRSLGPAPAEFNKPDPFMEISVGGLRFEDVEGAREGDQVLATLRIPTSPTVFHVTGRVVRVDVIPERERVEPLEDEPVRTHRIAIEFVSIPTKATDALCAYTEHLQNVQIAVTSDRTLPSLQTE